MTAHFSVPGERGGHSDTTPTFDMLSNNKIVTLRDERDLRKFLVYG